MNIPNLANTPARFDDLLEEEREPVQIAIRRLSEQESYDRIYRIRRATQCSYQHKLLPKEDWTKPEEVFPHPPSSLSREVRKRKEERNPC